MTEREFGKMCQYRGFIKLAPRYYARCYGDGIFQTIYTGFKEYIDPDSAYYLPDKRKSYYISIGVRSMYSYHLESTFTPGKDAGGYRPADFIDMRKFSGCFDGISKEYKIMEQHGFDALDSINTQEAFLNCWSSIHTLSSGGRIHDAQLVEPYLLCGHQDDAENEICISFMHCMSSLHTYLNHVESGRIPKNVAYEQELYEKAKMKMYLWNCCIGGRINELNSYIMENYSRNLSWLHKHNVPTYLLMHPRSMTDK